MSWQIIVALLIAIPVILLPVSLVWFLNIRGISGTIREQRSATQRERGNVPAEAE